MSDAPATHPAGARREWRPHRPDAHGPAVDDLLAATRYQRADVTTREGMGSVLTGCEGPVAIYVALPPAVAAEQCWRIVQPVLDAWRAGSVPMAEYPAGSTGPAEW